MIMKMFTVIVLVVVGAAVAFCSIPAIIHNNHTNDHYNSSQLVRLLITAAVLIRKIRTMVRTIVARMTIAAIMTQVMVTRTIRTI